MTSPAAQSSPAVSAPTTLAVWDGWYGWEGDASLRSSEHAKGGMTSCICHNCALTVGRSRGGTGRADRGQPSATLRARCTRSPPRPGGTGPGEGEGTPRASRRGGRSGPRGAARSRAGVLARHGRLVTLSGRLEVIAYGTRSAARVDGARRVAEEGERGGPAGRGRRDRRASSWGRHGCGRRSRRSVLLKPAPVEHARNA